MDPAQVYLTYYHGRLVSSDVGQITQASAVARVTERDLPPGKGGVISVNLESGLQSSKQSRFRPL